MPVNKLKVELLTYHVDKIRNYVYHCMVMENNIKDKINSVEQEHHDEQNIIDSMYTMNINILSATLTNSYDEYLRKIKNKRKLRKLRRESIRKNKKRSKILSYLRKELSFLHRIKMEYIYESNRISDLCDWEKTRDERVHRLKILNKKYPDSGHYELQLEHERHLEILKEKYTGNQLLF